MKFREKLHEISNLQALRIYGGLLLSIVLICLYILGKIWLACYVLFVIHTLYSKAYEEIPLRQSTGRFVEVISRNFLPSRAINFLGKFAILLTIFSYFLGYELINGYLNFLNRYLGSLYSHSNAAKINYA